uniref:Transmembrane protein 79 n=1 Tax=Felis catus TaxID=9685 RepID=A0ABI7XFR7_FELCA
MTEPETLALLEVKGSEAPEKSSPQALVPNGRQPEGEGGAESCGAESSGAGSSAGSPTAEEGTEDGLDSTVSEAATLPWGTGPQPSAPFPDPPGWRDIEPEPLRSEPPTKLEELSEDDANLLPEKAARAFVPIDLQCIERRPQEDLVVRCEAGEGERHRTRPPARATQPEPPERKWAEAAVRPPGRSCGACGGCGGRDGVRAVASVGAALVLFPCLLYGAYAFLPFDAPRLPTMSSRLIYTLRCGVFATFPIVLGEPGRGEGSGAGGRVPLPWASPAPPPGVPSRCRGGSPPPPRTLPRLPLPLGADPLCALPPSPLPQGSWCTGSASCASRRCGPSGSRGGRWRSTGAMWPSRSSSSSCTFSTWPCSPPTCPKRPSSCSLCSLVSLPSPGEWGFGWGPGEMRVLEGPRRLAWGDGGREPSGLCLSPHVRPASVPPLSPLHLASPGSRCVFPNKVEFRDPGTA